MNNKKIVFGIVLFLAICFLAFTFANPLEQGNGDGTLIQNGGNSTNTNNDDGKLVKEVVLTNPVKNKLGIGEAIKLEYTVSPSTATDKSLTYSSSDTSVVKVDQNGVVTAVGNGTATITVTSSNGKTTSVTFTVGEDTTTVADNNQNNTNGITVRPTYPVGGNTNNGSSNSGNNGNNNNSGNNSGNNGGTVVKPKPDPEPEKPVDTTVNVTEVKVNLNGSDTTLVIGQSANLSAVVSPSNATNKTVVYSSSNETVATVDKLGNITTKGIGTVSIIATASNGINNSITLNVIGNIRSNVVVSVVDGDANLNTGNFTSTDHMVFTGEILSDTVEIMARIYAPKYYNKEMLANFDYRPLKSPFVLTNVTDIMGSDRLYFDVKILVPKTMIMSSSSPDAKMTAIYVDWLGLGSEVEYLFDFSNLKAE